MTKWKQSPKGAKQTPGGNGRYYAGANAVKTARGQVNQATSSVNAVGQKRCPCTGREKSYIMGLGAIKSYTGNFPSPLQVMWFVPETNEISRAHIPDSEIRKWVKDAAKYHGIPHILLAVILQQENGPNATKFQKIGQFAERTLTTLGAIIDEYLWDIVPDKIAGGSSGFGNMSRYALKRAAKYSEEKYGRSPMPNSVRYRCFGWDQDTRISGDDWKADLYYCAAHLRQLIDRCTGKMCHSGPLTLEQVQIIICAYNGSGPLADKYGRDAMQTLLNAASGKGFLYFYEE